MLVQFVSRHYSDKLGNPSEKQVGMKRLLILGFTAGNTKTVFEVVDGFLNIHSDFVGGIPFGRTADRTGIGAQVFLGINIKHPAAGGDSVQGFSQWQTRLLLPVVLSYSHFIFGHTNFMVGSPQRRWDLLPSRFIGRDGSLGQQGTPSLFSGQSDSGREILPLRGM